MELKKIDSKKNLKDKTELMLFLLFVCFTLCLSVGYAALNSDLKISGEANFRVESDIRITNVSLYETTNLGLENYTSKYSKYTVTIGADLKQVNSTISYKVKVQNSGTISMWIDSIEETKNNDNIEYVLEGIGLKELINPGEEKEFTLKIKYKDSITTLPYNTNIDTILKFNFIKPESVLSHTSQWENQGVDDKFLTGPITRGSIESITFMPTLDVVEDAIGSWDASASKNGTVIASYKDFDGNGLYELYIGGIGVVYANSNQESLFYNLTKLKKITFNGYFDTSKTKTMYSMFRNCYLLESVDTNMFDTSNVTNMGGMFINCQKLKNIDVSSFDTSNVTNMIGMFSDCRSLENIDVSNFNTSNVTSVANNYGGMFMNCYELKTLDLSSFDTSKITNIKQMFYGCSSLESLNLTGFDTSKVTDMSRVFTNCLKLKTITGLDKFNTSNVKTMSQMFQGLKEMVSLDLSNFDTSNVTNMQLMFFGDIALTDVNLTSFNTSNLTTTYQMFYNCKSLKKLDLQSFDTTNVVDMSGMFNTCVALENILIDSNKFITSNTNNMSLMFFNCTALVNIDLSKFDTSNVNDMNNMFNTCTSLELIDLRSFTFNESVKTNAMFANTKPNVLVYVKDEAQKQYVLSIRNDLTNVQIKEA